MKLGSAMASILPLTNLLSQISSLPEAQEEVHGLILTTLIKCFGGSPLGWIGIEDEGHWRTTAGALEPWVTPRATFIERSNQGILGLRHDCGDQGAVAVQVLQVPGTSHPEAKTILKVAIDILLAYESLRLAWLRNRALEDQTRQILDLATALGSGSYPEEAFYRELLLAARRIIPESDGGSIAVCEKGQWRFLTADGHDESFLLELTIPERGLVDYFEPTLVTNLPNPGSRDAVDEPLALKAKNRALSETLVQTLILSPTVKIHFSLDVFRDSGKRFSAAAKESFSRLGQLVRPFVLFRTQKDQSERSSRRLAEKLALLAEAHDRETALHNERVAAIAVLLARKLDLSEDKVQKIRQGALLHDIGKLFLEPVLLNKTGPLSSDERSRLRQHTLWAEQLLDDEAFETDRKIAVHHHERFDGAGYPHGLIGDQIPLEAQIVSVADCFDALRSQRAYKAGFGALDAVQRMELGDERMAPGAFNPVILELLKASMADLEILYG